MIKNNIRKTSEYEYMRTYSLIKNKYNTEDPYELTKYINEDKKIAITTKINRINTILSFNLHDIKKIQDDNVLKEIRSIRDKLQNDYRKKMEENNLTEKQEIIMNKISYKKLTDLKASLNHIKNDSNDNLKHYLIVSMLIQYPSRNDFKSLKIINNEKDNNDKNINYILINDEICEIILNYYKTSDKYNTIRLNINKLKNDILKYISQNPQNIYLFEFKQKPMTTQRFSYEVSEIFNKYLKYKITSTILRKIDLSEKYAKIMEIMRKDNMVYGNSLSMRIGTYIQNKKIKD